MKCTKCNTDTRVVETRSGVIRRRECMTCGIRFTTVEVLREDLPDEMIPAAPKRTPKKVMRRARRMTIGSLVYPSMPNIPPARKRIEDLSIDRSVNGDWWD